ncbi:MAG: GntR family transcriptional regulator [Cypionkella sp.]|jgi:GntR family transcriptional regulator, rspAB operon transcriptional repressor
MPTAPNCEALDRTGQVGPQLLRALRHMIIRNQLQPGARLSEKDIADRFGVSRQPVREVFIKLAEEGLLEIRPQRGTFVLKISIDAVLDARFVREAVEADVVKLCAELRPAGLVETLRAQLAAQERIASEGGIGFVPLDDLFHRTLAEAAGRPKAWDVIEGMKSQLDRVRQLSTKGMPLTHLIDQHRAITEAIASGDPAKADHAMRAHLKVILEDLPAIRAAFPQYFEGTP